MNRLAIDASIAVEYLLRTETGLAAADVVERADLYAPELLDAEVMSVLRRAVLNGALQEHRAREALEDLEVWGVERIPHKALSRLAWRHIRDISACDSYYVAAAQAFGIPLLTADRRLGRVPNIPVKVHTQTIA